MNPYIKQALIFCSLIMRWSINNCKDYTKYKMAAYIYIAVTFYPCVSYKTTPMLFIRRFIIVIMIGISFTATAQSSYRTRLQDYYLQMSSPYGHFARRLSLSFGKYFIPGKVDVDYSGIPDSLFVDTTMSLTMHARRSYTIAVGDYFPLAIISDNSMLVCNIELMGSYSKLTYDTVYFADSGKLSQSFETFRAGIPISIEYRAGGDVTLNKNSTMMFTIGGGVNVGIIRSLDDRKVMPYKATPFIKLEMGAFAGLAFKARLVYNFGNSYYAKNENQNVLGNDYVSSAYRGTNGISFSIVIMPFSYKWER